EHDRLAAAGVRVLRAPVTEPWGLIEMWIEDPDGVRIVLVEVPPDHQLRRDSRSAGSPPPAPPPAAPPPAAPPPATQPPGLRPAPCPPPPYGGTSAASVVDIKVGPASWPARPLSESGWSPPEARTPAARLKFYASRFPLVEVDSTYYALPGEQNAASWAERTPGSFTFNVKAFSLLTHHPTRIAALPADLREAAAQEDGKAT